MSLRRLCFVLPMDADEALLAAKEPRHRVMTREIVWSYVRGKVGRVLSCLRCGPCCGGADRSRHDPSVMVFEDIAGVYEARGRKVPGASESPRIFSYSELYIGTNGFND